MRDVGSLNGTYVNRERVDEARPPHDGDELQVGKFKLGLRGRAETSEHRQRDHLSIGEVLSLLQDEFPDVTISKIRFLESQGLIDPERTPSGYRKFYDGDIERLRWILHQQRDHFLPLKVIKDRILNGFADDDEHGPGAGVDRESDEHRPASGDGAADDRAGDETPDDETPEETPAPAPVAASEPMPRPGPESSPVASGGDGVASAADPLDEGMSTVSMTADELAAASGLTADEVDDLHRFGLIVSRPIGAADLYEGEALQVARLAADFVGRGIEIRHLKMYRISAEREAGFYEQVVSPLAGHRDPATRVRARAEVRDLVRLGAELKASLLRRSLRDQLGGP